jgi:hypothetical protein
MSQCGSFWGQKASFANIISDIAVQWTVAMNEKNKIK